MAQPPAKKKHILVIGQTKGFEHDSVPDAMGTVWKLGMDSDLWTTYLRTDTELITKGKVGANGKNLNYFDLLVFASTTGEMDLTDEQKKDMMSFIHDDGKGFVGIHAALDSNYKWPEYGEMIGGWFDQHPWGTFNAPILNEGGNFPATAHFPKSMVKKQTKSIRRRNGRATRSTFCYGSTRANWITIIRGSTARITISRWLGPRCTARGACSTRPWDIPTTPGRIPTS